MAATYRMAVVTTAKRRDFELIHRERRIVRHMEFVLTGDDYQPHKPHPAGYLAALERFGAAADEAVVIEDSKQGLDAARGAGLACLIVHNPVFRNGARLRRRDARARVCRRGAARAGRNPRRRVVRLTAREWQVYTRPVGHGPRGRPFR